MLQTIADSIRILIISLHDNPFGGFVMATILIAIVLLALIGSLESGKATGCLWIILCTFVMVTGLIILFFSIVRSSAY